MRIKITDMPPALDPSGQELMEVVQDGHSKKLRLDALATFAMNAYQIAISNGFEGTEQEWLESLIGPKGDKGDPGLDGKSSYELAQQEGYEGTLEDWLMSLKGPKGDKGDPGGSGLENVEIPISTPLDTWVLNHNLGAQPQITLLSVGGKELIAEIVRISDNQALVYFDTPTAGKAICS